MSKDLYIKSRTLTSDDWVRPTDWLAMPTLTSADDEFVGLYAIFPDGENFATLTMTTSTGTYDVDWGDGVVDTVASGALASHQYNYTTYDAGNTTLCSRGYKQAFITVTANTGLFRTCNFQTRFVTSPVQNQFYSTGWLDIVCSFPNLNTGNTFTFGGNTIIHTFLERFDCKSVGSITSMANLFQNCYSLQRIEVFDTSNVTNMSNMFSACGLLKVPPFFNTLNVTNMSSMFTGCLSLREIPTYNTVSVTNMATMFQSCKSLPTIPLLNTANVTLMNGMFSACDTLEYLPLLNTASVTNMSTMFNLCYNLKQVPLFNTANVTTMNGMMNGCYCLVNIPALSTASITTTTGSDFASWTSLANCGRIEVIFARAINLSNGQLSRTALVEIFNNLADRTATTSANINITNNWGASALTAGERLIATSKNWSITG